jgi:hypothetical protein
MGKVLGPQFDGLTQHCDVIHAGLKLGARAVRLLAGACRADVVLLAVSVYLLKQDVVRVSVSRRPRS